VRPSAARDVDAAGDSGEANPALYTPRCIAPASFLFKRVVCVVSDWRRCSGRPGRVGGEFDALRGRRPRLRDAHAVPRRSPTTAAARALLPRAAAAAAGVAAAAAAAGAAARCAPIDELRGFRRGTDLGRLNLGAGGDVPPERRVVVVVGVTGAGKSSTCNTLAGRLHKPFAVASAASSVTRAVGFRDYLFASEEWRVIDTPGLGDTHRPPAEIRAELRALAALAPHGVSAVLLVVPAGRLTGAHEAAAREVAALFGGPDAFARAAVVAVTGAVSAPGEGRHLLTRDAVVEGFDALPLGSYFRALCAAVAGRVVPVENRWDPHRYYSRLALHQRVLDCEDARGGARVDVARFAEGDGPRAAVVDEGGADGGGARRALPPCAREVVVRPDGASVLRIECEL